MNIYTSVSYTHLQIPVFESYCRGINRYTFGLHTFDNLRITCHNRTIITVLFHPFSFENNKRHKNPVDLLFYQVPVSYTHLTGVDSELMDELKADHELVITLEDGVLDGGFGEKIARYYGATDMKVLNYGAKKEFVDRYDIQELLRANHLTDEQIVEDILSLIG